MSDDLVQRLRALGNEYGFGAPWEAADRIETLEVALKRIAECAVPGDFAYELQQVARRALESKP